MTHMKSLRLCSVTCFLVLGSTYRCLADAKLTFLDVGQGDATVIQIAQATGEPLTIIVDGGDGDSDLTTNLPGLLSQDPTIELVVLSHPHKAHTGALDWLITSQFTVKRVWWTEESADEGNYKRFKNRI